MRISDKALEEFIEIYKEEFGEEIERQEAAELAQSVLMLYQVLSKKPPGKRVSSSTPRPDDHPPIGFQI
jgi:hypothetical protein